MGCSSKSAASKTGSKGANKELLPAKEVIERHILESGGFELLSSMSTMHVVWTKLHNGSEWKFERWRVRGQDFAQRSIDGEVKHSLGCWVADPEVDDQSLQGVVWTQTGDRVFLQGGDRMKERLAETATIDDRTKWFETNKSIETTGITKVNGRDCYRLEFRGHGKELTHRFFDTETFMLRRKDRFDTEANSGQQTQTFSDFKKVGSFMMPMTQAVISEHRMDVWKVESIEFDSEIDIDQFPVPGEALAAMDKVLKRIRIGTN